MNRHASRHTYEITYTQLNHNYSKQVNIYSYILTYCTYILYIGYISAVKNIKW